MAVLSAWLLSLPLAWKIATPLIVLVATVIVSLWGGLSFQWGKKTIRLGYKGKGNNCMDCSRYVRITQTKVNREIATLENKKLKDKMNYVEHKLLGLKSIIFQSFSKAMHAKGAYSDGLTGLSLDMKESQECNLFEARLGEIMQIMKDEIRRSFKENGFHEISEVEFSVYINGQTKTLSHMINSYLAANYPRQMILTLDEVQDLFEILHRDMEDIIEYVYRNAKEVELDTEQKISVLENQYELTIDNFATEKQGK